MHPGKRARRSREGIAYACRPMIEQMRCYSGFRCHRQVGKYGTSPTPIQRRVGKEVINLQSLA